MRREDERGNGKDKGRRGERDEPPNF